MIPRIALVDTLTPEVRRWLEQLSPGVLRAARRGAAQGRLLLRQSYDRFLSSHRGAGRRGIKARVRKTVAGPVIELWPSVGYVAAHELGSTIPAVRIEPRKARVLRFVSGGTVRYARFVQRPAFTLPRRPWVSVTVEPVTRAVVETLEAEIGKVFAVPGFTSGGTA